jgi:signal transduction histidine kinase
VARTFDRLSYGTHDPDLVQRTRVLFAYAGTSFVLAIAWGAMHLADGIVGTSIIFFTTALVQVVLMVKLWLDRKLDFASHGILLTATVAIVVACYITGGLRLTNIALFILIIVPAIFLLGKQGIPYAVASLLIALVFQAAHWLGYMFPDVIPPEDRALDAFITWFISGAMILLFTLSYERARVLGMKRLREANLAKSQFLANISHEIRTPLHVIMGMNTMLEKSELTPEQSTHLATAKQNSEALLALINDLLDMTSMEHGSFSLKKESFDPAVVAREVSDILRFRCEDKDLSFSFAVHSETPELVLGDRQRLRQVLLNLGSNAVKYTESGAVAMELRPGKKGAPACRFVFRDTGMGIENKDRDRIFQSFTQVDGGLARRHEGAGLGLYISRELVRLMGGRIELDSEPGRGSTFVVDIPFEDAAGEASAAQDAVA